MDPQFLGPFSQMCDRCLSILKQPATVKPEAWFASWECETTASALYSSAAACFPCRVVKRNLESIGVKGSPDVSIPLKYIVRRSVMDDQIPWVSIQANMGPGRIYYSYMLLEALSGRDDFVRLEGNSTGSAETLGFIKDQLRICRDSHKTCHRSAAKQVWYPTRLVEVLDDGARLIVTAETKPTGPYASLSHRWGSLPEGLFRCTTDTIEDLKTGIQLQKLSITFRDALHTLKFLGLRYIWIDSICIIQDSGADWSYEARTMMKVYEGACLNLAATRSSNHQIGLFADRNPRLMESGPFYVDNGAVKGYFRLVEAALDMVYWNREVETAPLNTRGWVMQERVLSSSIVHFTSEQVIWDCGELTASETGPCGVLARPGMKTIWIGCKKDSTISKLPRDRLGALGQWATLISAYSNCSLSFPTDKFIALAGAARLFQEFLEDDYCCGLWRSQMEMQICWFTDRPAGRTRVATGGPIAPSWSWMSVDGPIQAPQLPVYEGYAVKLLATILDVKIVRRGVDGDGQGESYTGSIHLRCILNAVQMQLPTASGQHRLTGHGMEHSIRVAPDTSEFSGTSTGDLYLIPIFELQDPVMATRKIRVPEVSGLLVRLVGEKAGTFTRCGHVSLSTRSDPSTGEYAKSWLDLMSTSGKEDLPCKNFNIERGHLIKIV